jgi:hypothetical protein
MLDACTKRSFSFLCAVYFTNLLVSALITRMQRTGPVPDLYGVTIFPNRLPSSKRALDLLVLLVQRPKSCIKGVYIASASTAADTSARILEPAAKHPDTLLN